MDVFRLRDAVVGEYRDYVESFVRVLDPRVDAFVGRRLAEGELWPDAVLQLNPAFQAGPTLEELARRRVICPETARFFGPQIRLHQHQFEALEAAARGEPYVVTTGTGSGKSLTYLVPIYDAIVRADAGRPGVRAVIVYPMNALINSQLAALTRFAAENFPASPVRFDQYTGQTRRDDRERITRERPHIILTNYVMLEYLLVRPYERDLLAAATSDLRFLVLDELHFYRGRQGADVAMLVRRVRRSASGELQVIGTSATLAAGEALTREQRREIIASAASRMFGALVPTANVIDESLRRVARVPAPATRAELRAAVEATPPAASVEAVTQHPLAAWVEETFGLAEREGRLVRQDPQTFSSAVGRLVAETGLDEARCRERLRAVLEAGNTARFSPDQPVFAFRLYQFLSSGSSVYATLDPADQRELTMAAQYRAAAGRLLYPLVFCRECGQEYYLCTLLEAGEGAGPRLLPRPAMDDLAGEETAGEPGFFSLEDGTLWAGDDEELPESWFDQARGGPRLKPRYRPHVPRGSTVTPDGSLSGAAGPGVRGWFQPRPLLLCLRCRAAYDPRDGDFRKLSSLSQTGRSTATTVSVAAAVTGLADDPEVDREARKVLSFTDNRQDASLQAGHLNDFVLVAQLRAAIVQAIEQAGPVGFDRLGPLVFEALAPRPAEFMREPVESGPGYEQARRAMIDLLEYRALEDLGRGWRVAQPNLEQSGLLRVEYAGLDELAADEGLWMGLPAISAAPPSRRQEVLRAVLDHLRSRLAIDAEALTEQATRRLTRVASQWLRDPWALEERDRLKTGSHALLPGAELDRRDQERLVVRLGPRSAVARYLRSRLTWGLDRNLSAEEAEELVRGIVAALRGHLLAVSRDRQGRDSSVRVLAGALRWARGDGRPLPPDPVRARSLHLRREVGERAPNRYFTGLYTTRARRLSGMVGREHTGQVDPGDRVEREQEFAKGNLPVLFCSPTMELGVDIRDLNAVHMRNVPPTPANFAQRSGRAGRNGRPALVVTFAAQGNAHDQYFFRQRNGMIAGAVAPARMDLRNRELVEAHLHAVWLATVGLSLGSGMAELLDLEQPEYPLLPEKLAHVEDRARYHRRALEACRALIDRAPEVREAWWYSEEWLEEVVQHAPRAFDLAFDRWRALYRAALAMRDEARRTIDSPRAGRPDREQAEQRERIAKREIELLLNQGRRGEESDFYPYRYLAAEGFLPGYNFPRVPVRVLVTVRDRAQVIARPRFLGLTEFGPDNVLYHEGRKHIVDTAILPPAGLESLLRRARLCRECGYAHDGAAAEADLCEHCQTAMDAATSDFPQRLLEQPTARARPVEHISSDEEERVRRGYRVTTHYRFSPSAGRRVATVVVGDGAPILQAVYAAAATLWRINHGWLQGDGTGFRVDPLTGRWQRREPEPGDDEGAIDTQRAVGGVKPYVTDSRNLLLLRPIGTPGDETFTRSLLYALQRGIQFAHQVEEQEVAAELIGRGQHLRLLFWEAAEGGTGVWERLIEEPAAFAEVARQALQVCHFDPETGEADPAFDDRCSSGCYECLLSYSNQLQHRHLDRHAIRDFLLRLAHGMTGRAVEGRDYDEQHEWLRERIDPASSLEADFLDHLYRNRLRLPDLAQHRPANGVAAQVDFYYERDDLPGVCVFVDGPDHDAPARAQRDRAAREALEDRGHRVVAIRYDRPFDEQIARFQDVFGTT